ncbi:MAG TPA: 50S ribosomal protein L9 [Cyclobacteriaceae bacterium]|nr:50S ribosomal protein L9 [Cyclobacteriaceae bacterium]
MEVILIQDIAGLGFKNDTVKVKAGYGRNYLIPRGMAIIANNSNRKKTDEEIRQAAHKAEKLRNDALALADSIGDLVLEVGAKVGESGKIFGAVTALQISDALRDKGFEVDRKKIAFNSEVKAIGEYNVTLSLHKEVKKIVKFRVVAE